MTLQSRQFPVRKLSKVLVKCVGGESAILKNVEEGHSLVHFLFWPLPALRISLVVYLIKLDVVLPMFAPLAVYLYPFPVKAQLNSTVFYQWRAIFKTDYLSASLPEIHNRGFFYYQTCCNFTVSMLEALVSSVNFWSFKKQTITIVRKRSLKTTLKGSMRYAAFNNDRRPNEPIWLDQSWLTAKPFTHAPQPRLKQDAADCPLLLIHSCSNLISSFWVFLMPAPDGAR